MAQPMYVWSAAPWNPRCSEHTKHQPRRRQRIRPRPPSVSCSSSRIPDMVLPVLLHRTPGRPFPSSHFPLGTSSDPPSLAHPRPLQETQVPSTGRVVPSSWRPALLRGHHVPGRDNHGGGASAALSGPPCPCLAPDPSDSNAGSRSGHGGKITQNGLTATTSTFWCNHHPRTSVLGKWPAPPSSSTLPRSSGSESRTHHRWAPGCAPGPPSSVRGRLAHVPPARLLPGVPHSPGLPPRPPEGLWPPYRHFYLVYIRGLMIIFGLKKKEGLMALKSLKSTVEDKMGKSKYMTRLPTPA